MKTKRDEYIFAGICFIGIITLITLVAMEPAIGLAIIIIVGTGLWFEAATNKR